MTSNQLRIKIATDYSASSWLKAAIEKSANRDVIDALEDARTLLKFCELRYAETLARPPKPLAQS